MSLLKVSRSRVWLLSSFLSSKEGELLSFVTCFFSNIWCSRCFSIISWRPTFSSLMFSMCSFLQTCNRCLTMGWRVQYTRSHIWFPGLDVVQGSPHPSRLLGHGREDKLLLQLGTFGERFRRLLVLLLRIGERALDRWVEGARRS